jgi:hypothetical protein
MPLDESTNSGKAASRRSLYLWLAASTLALVLLVLLPGWVLREASRAAEFRHAKQLMDEQIAEVKAGKRTRLMDLDPRFLQDVIQDKECASRITEVWIASRRSMSDDRFRLLKQFPNLRTIWFEYVDNTDEFLGNIQGLDSLEEIVFDCAWFSPAGTRHLRSFPHLKLLRLGTAAVYRQNTEELQRALPNCKIVIESK